MRASEFITEKWSNKYKRSIDCSHPKGFSQKAHCAGRKKTNEADFAGQQVQGNAYTQFKEKFPNLSTLAYFIPGFGQALLAADVASQVQMYNQAIAQIEKKYPEKTIQAAQAKVGDTTELEPIDPISTENFANGKNPGRKGLAKRSGVNCKQSVSKLRSIAKNSSGERQRMAHWCANMKSGRNK